jgi:type II secretory pathway component PulJ
MKCSGYTLVQLLVALTLTGLLLGAFATVHGRARQAVSRIESLAAVQDTLVQAMAGAANLKVPLVVDVGTARSWAEAH